MNRLNRYIFKEIFLFSSICLFAFTGVFVTIQLLKTSSLVVSKGVQASQILLVFVSIIPTFLELAIPLSTLLGVMLAYARLSGDSEIIVIRASGLSLRQLLSSVLAFAVLTMALAAVVSLELKPWGYRKLGETLFQLAQTRSTAGLEPGIFNELGQLTLYAEEIDYATGELSKVTIHDRRDPERYTVIFSKTGFIASNEKQESINFLLKDGTIHEQIGEEYNLTSFQDNAVQIRTSELYPDQDSRKRKTRELSGQEIESELYATATLLARNQFESEEELRSARNKFMNLQVERELRVALPFATLILAFVGMPLGIQPPRAQKTFGAGLSTTIGLLTFLLYYGILSVGIAMAESGTLSPVIAVWIPNFVGITVAALGIREMSGERWQSIGHALQSAIERIVSLTKRLRRKELRA